MTFVTADGRKVRLSVPNADTTKTGPEVEGAMNSIIMADAFAPGGSALAMAESARFVAITITDLEI